MTERTAASDLDRIELKRAPSPTGRRAGRQRAADVVFVHGLLVDGKLWTGWPTRWPSGDSQFAPNWPIGSHPIPMNPNADLSPRGIAKIVLDFLAALS